MKLRWSEENLTHIPVLKEAVLSFLNIRSDGIFLDGTIGLGGHAEAILSHLTSQGLLVGFDGDAEALKRCKTRLAPASTCHLIHDSYDNFPSHLHSLGIEEVDGMLLDLGLSSFQLDSARRGFSYRLEGPLDMRFNVNSILTAEKIVNNWDENHLKRILKEYGEERRAGRIAKQIVTKRRFQHINTTTDLRNIIADSVGGSHLTKTLSRVFQALRITVNRELDTLQNFLEIFIDYLRIGGRIIFISYHSLEDRLVKRTLQQLEKGCTCPPELPICQCGKKPGIRILTKKAIRPGEAEIKQNVRARSAKLRAGEKIG